LCQGRERESGNLLLPTSTHAGEEEEQCCSKWHYFGFFYFGRKGNEFENNSKMGYDSCPLFTTLTEQRLCAVSFVKINKTELPILIFSKLG
jgi:hypothetical protein